MCMQQGMLSLQLAISSYRYCYPNAVMLADTCYWSIGMVCSLAEFTHACTHIQSNTHGSMHIRTQYVHDIAMALTLKHTHALTRVRTHTYMHTHTRTHTHTLYIYICKS